MNAWAMIERLKTAGAETRRYWYYALFLYALQVAIIHLSATRSAALLPALGIAAAFIVLFTVVVGDPGRGRGITNLAVAAKLVGYYAGVSTLTGIATFGVSAVTGSVREGLGGGMGEVPSLFALIASRLTTDAVYWTTVAFFLLFFMGAYRLASHGRLRSAFRESPAVFLRRPVQTGAAIVTAFLLVYLPMMVLGAAAGSSQLSTVALAGGTVPTAVFVLLGGTSIGGVVSMRFLSVTADQLWEESAG